MVYLFSSHWTEPPYLYNPSTVPQVGTKQWERSVHVHAHTWHHFVFPCLAVGLTKEFVLRGISLVMER